MLLPVYTHIIDWLEQHQLPCLFKTVFHFDCPGCGLQRSILALLRGEVAGSLRLYPAVLPVLLLFAYSGYYLARRNKNGPAVIRFLFIAAASVIFIQYIYRTVILIN